MIIMTIVVVVMLIILVFSGAVVGRRDSVGDRELIGCNSSLKGCPNLGIYNSTMPSPFSAFDHELNAHESCTAPYPDFVLVNCTSSSSSHLPVFWPSFTKAFPEQDVAGAPAVIGMSVMQLTDYLYYNDLTTEVNLTWDSHLMRPAAISQNYTAPNSACSSKHPHSATNLSHYFPTSLNLSRLQLSGSVYTSFGVSINTVFLLLNCSNVALIGMTHYSPVHVISGEKFCQQYTGACNSILTDLFHKTPSCHQLKWSRDGVKYVYLSELSLQRIMDTMSCTHFEVFVVSSAGSLSDIEAAEVTQWLPGALQLHLSGPGCTACRSKNGACVFADATNDRTYQGCNCTNERGNHYFAYMCEYEFNCWRIGSILICPPTQIILLLIVVPIVAGLLLIVALCCCGYRCGKRSMRLQRLKMRTLWEIRRQQMGSNHDPVLSDQLAHDLHELSERPVEFSYKSLKSATSSFSSIVGKGGFGVVFKGVLADKFILHKPQLRSISGTPHIKQQLEIAVKVLDVRSGHNKKQFRNEVAIIGRVHHINVVRLLGFCVQDEQEMLVYEYVANGSLDTWLFDQRRACKNEELTMRQLLEWKQRYSIAVGIAKGLSYLHEECRHRIVHCDIKPQNILLDEQMCPKISDFGLARLMKRGESRVVTNANGTPGYMAPEIWVGGDVELSTKADIYSFGMVLLELISGRRNFNALELPSCSCFPGVAFDAAIIEGNFESLLDSRLSGRQSSSVETTIDHQQQQQQIRTAVMVAMWCIQDNPASRPCMSEVVQFLEGVAAVPDERPPRPAIASSSATSVLQQHHMMPSSTAFPSAQLSPR